MGSDPASEGVLNAIYPNAARLNSGILRFVPIMMIRIFNRISNYWLCQIGGWGLVGFSLLFYAVIFKDAISKEQIYKMFIYVGGGIISTHLLREFFRRSGWMILPIEKMFSRLIIAILLCSAFYSLLVLISFDLLTLSGIDHVHFVTRFSINILNQGIFIAPWVLIYYFYHYIETNRQNQLDTLKLESLVKELELKTIKSHINPHFIFNALNSIRALIDENPSRARNAITELSNILRSSMQADKLEVVSLERELSIVKDYLALEHIRFEDRLKVDYQIETQTLDVPVPPMMLQTLAENAIKHGISQSLTGGSICISSKVLNDDALVITITNSGSLQELPREDGFGLTSTRNRLLLLFGEHAGFEIRQASDDMVEAMVTIPLNTNKPL